MLPILLQVAAPNPLPAMPVISDPTTLTNAYEALVPQWIAAVTPYATSVFWALAGLEVAAMAWTLRKHWDDWRVFLMSATSKLLMIGVFLAFLMNASSWMGSIINMFITVGKAGSGIPGIGPSTLLTQGFKIFGSMLGQAVLNGVMMSFATAGAVIIAALIICFCFLTITIEFIVLKVQTFLVLGMGFFFLAFGGSSWTRPHVEKYFSYAIGSGVRLMTLYFLVGAGYALSNTWIAQAQNAPWTIAGVEACWVIMCGAVIYAAICWRCPAMAAQMLSGGPNLSHNEIFGAMGAAMTAAAAAVMVASGVSAGAGAALGGSAGSGSASGGAVAATGATAPSASTTTPTVTPSSGRSGGGGVQAAASAVRTAGNTLSSMGGHAGHTVHPPNFSGFGDHH